MISAPVQNTFELLTSGTISNAATTSIDLSNFYLTYNEIDIELINIRPVTDAALFQMRVSPDGTNYDASAGNYRWVFKYNDDSPLSADGGSTSATSGALSGTGSGVDSTATTSGWNGTLKVRNAGSATFLPIIRFEGGYINGNGNGVVIAGSVIRAAGQVTRGIRILFSTGNISVGSYKVYGRKS